MGTKRSGSGDRGGFALVEAMEPRRLLAAAPVPNVLGLYAGSLTRTGGGSESLTITITTQHQRTIAGSFAQGSGPVAKFQGTVNPQGVLRFTYQGSGFTGRGSGSFNATDTVLDATFLTRQRGFLIGGDLEVRLQGTRPAVPTLPQLGGSEYAGTVRFADGSTDSIDLKFASQRNKTVTGFYGQGNGALASFTGTVDINGSLRFRFQGGLPRFHGTGSGTVSNANQEIDGTFTRQQAGRTLAGSFSMRRVTG